MPKQPLVRVARRRREPQTVSQRNARLANINNSQWGTDNESLVPTEQGHFQSHNHPDLKIAHGTPVPKNQQRKLAQGVSKAIKQRAKDKEAGLLDDEVEPTFGENKARPQDYIRYLTNNAIDWIVSWDGYKIYHPALKMDDEWMGEEYAGLNSLIEDRVDDATITADIPETVQAADDGKLDQILNMMGGINDRLNTLEDKPTFGKAIEDAAANPELEMVITDGHGNDIIPDGTGPATQIPYTAEQVARATATAVDVLNQQEREVDHYDGEGNPVYVGEESTETIPVVIPPATTTPGPAPVEKVLPAGRWSSQVTRKINKGEITAEAVIVIHTKIGRTVTNSDLPG